MRVGIASTHTYLRVRHVERGNLAYFIDGILSEIVRVGQCIEMQAYELSQKSVGVYIVKYTLCTEVLL